LSRIQKAAEQSEASINLPAASPPYCYSPSGPPVPARPPSGQKM